MDAKDCRTLEDIIVFLVSNLKWCDNPTAVDGWKQIMGFRRAFCIHQVWKSDDNHFVFHVDDYEGWDPTTEPNMGRYDSFMDLLQGVAKRYHKLWMVDMDERL